MNPLALPSEDGRNKDFTTIRKAKCDMMMYFIISTRLRFDFRELFGRS